MIKEFFKISLRNLKKNKGYSFINMIGLSLGMACAVLISLWVNDELSYNRLHKNYDDLYSVMENQDYDGKIYTFSAMPGPFAPAIKEELPEIKYAARTSWGDNVLFSLGDKAIYEQGYYTDPDFLNMFSFQLIKGDRNKLLQDPSSIVITDEMAEKFFGKENAIGKTLKANNDKIVTVAGVVQRPPLNSSLRFSWLASFTIYENKNEWLREWGNNSIRTYVQLNKGASKEQVNKKFYNFIQKKDTSASARPFLFSINDWRLRSDFVDGKQTGAGRIEYVRLFSIIALLIVIIACINFMNLATARSEQRAREVGVRKVMGAGRRTLISQFMGESVVMSFVAMLIAVLIVLAFLPAFNELVEKKLKFSLSNPVICLGFPLLGILCGILAGSYPSLYLSSFNPTTVFRGLRIGKNSMITNIRRGLVVVQFVVSIVLIVSTIIIYKQIQHVKARQLGYDKENVLLIPLRGNMNEHFSAIRQDLLATGFVQNAAVSTSRVLSIGSSSSDFMWEGKSPEQQLLVSMEWVSPQYVSTMGMQIIQGRDFYQEGSSDTSSIIVNETFAKAISKENPVGKILRMDENSTLTIVGVVKDFVYNDMYKKPDPLTLFCTPNAVNTMLVRLKNNQDPARGIAGIESVLKKNNPGYPFEYEFMDDQFNKLFNSEMLIGKLSRIFAFLTIFICCLGLFGLAAYTAERRTKEIGIRKVLGASISSVVGLLSKDFLRLVAIASVIAFPLAWLMMKKWLQGYSYRIDIHWWFFAIAGILAIIIALFTVSFQAIKAAIANPVNSLRSE